MTTEWKSICLYPIPSIIYLIHNNGLLYQFDLISTKEFGVLFTMALSIVDDFKNRFEKGPLWQHLFIGYSITTWLVVLNLGSAGLLVSWLMMYADNVMKVYSTSMAMLLMMVLSAFLFDLKPTLQACFQQFVFFLIVVQLFLGISICMMSLHMYFAPPTMLLDLPSTTKAVSHMYFGACIFQIVVHGGILSVSGRC